MVLKSSPSKEELKHANEMAAEHAFFLLRAEKAKIRWRKLEHVDHYLMWLAKYRNIIIKVVDNRANTEEGVAADDKMVLEQVDSEATIIKALLHKHKLGSDAFYNKLYSMAAYGNDTAVELVKHLKKYNKPKALMKLK